MTDEKLPDSFEDFLAENPPAPPAPPVLDNTRGPTRPPAVFVSLSGPAKEAIAASPSRPLKPAEAAELLAVHVNTIKRYIDAGWFPGAFRVGRRGDWRLPPESIERFKRRGGS